MKQNAKICAIGEHEVFILGGQGRERIDGGEGEDRGLRKGAERGYRDRREKRDKRELS